MIPNPHAVKLAKAYAEVNEVLSVMAECSETRRLYAHLQQAQHYLGTSLGLMLDPGPSANFDTAKVAA